MESNSPNLIKFRPLSYVKQALVSPGRRPMRVRAGLFKNLILDLDPATDTQISLGLYEQETFFSIRQAARDSAWMLDIGAGSGELAIFFLRQPKCLAVHAFEPQPAALAIFRRNLALNNLSEDFRLVIHPTFAGAGGTALDSLSLDLDAPGFLKIDVDGAEMDVLDSAGELLTQGKPDVLVETHSEALEAACIARLTGLGYRVKIIKNAWWRFAVPEQRPTAHNRWIFGMKARFSRQS
jgi:precorrin-6B methylase 2